MAPPFIRAGAIFFVLFSGLRRKPVVESHRILGVMTDLIAVLTIDKTSLFALHKKAKSRGFHPKQKGFFVMSSCKQTLRRYAHRYLIDAMGAMAQGLFASLLVGTIISTIGSQCNLALLVEIGNYAKAMAGPAMARGYRVCPKSFAVSAIFPGSGGSCGQHPRRPGRPAGCFSTRYHSA